MKHYLQNVNKKMKPKIYWFLTNEGMSLIICSIVLIGAFVFTFNNKVEGMNWIDYTVFFTVIVALFVNFIAIFLNKVILVYFEDDMKLTTDYDVLAKRYIDDKLLRFDNDLNDGVSEKNDYCGTKAPVLRTLAPPGADNSPMSAGAAPSTFNLQFNSYT